MTSLTARMKAAIKARAPFLVPILKAIRSIGRLGAGAVSQVARRVPGLRDLRRSTLDRRRGAVFEKIYRTNAWQGIDSRSGVGSDLGRTAAVRRELPSIVEQYGFRSMLDIPCGDFFWMRHVALELDYIGADLVPTIIARNRLLFEDDRHRFVVLDMARDDLPMVDLVFCRDGLVHLSYEDALLAIAKFKRSGSRFLMATTFLDCRRNRDSRAGQWRELNMRLPPFGFPAPLAVVREHLPSEPYPDKSMGLWRIAELP